MLSCATLEPVAEGASLTLSRHVDDCGIDCPFVHWLPIACRVKSAAFVPVIVAGGVPMTRFAAVVLVIVKVCRALEPNATLP